MAVGLRAPTGFAEVIHVSPAASAPGRRAAYPLEQAQPARGMSAPELSAAEVRPRSSAARWSPSTCASRSEWEAGHIAGALWIPMGEFADRVWTSCRRAAGDRLPQRRAQRGGGRLRWRAPGYDAVNLAGGLQAWHAARLPIEPVDGWIA